MKKAKKILFTLLAGVLAVGSVASMGACGKEKNSNTKVTTEDTAVVGYDGSAVTITFYHSMGAKLKGVLDAGLAEFNAMYPNIKVEHRSYGDYDGVRDQINTELNAGYAPSVAFCYPDHVALYNTMKVVRTMDDYVNSDLVATRADGTTEKIGLTDEQKNDYVEAYFEEGKAYGDGKLYSLPFARSTEVLYYNKTEFEKNGWQVPTTWDEMETLCAEIKAQFPDSIPLGYDSEANWFITMCEQLKSGYTTATKGNHFVFNNKTNQDFVKRFAKWYHNGWVTTEELYGGYTSDLFKTTTSTTRSFMCIGSSAGATYQCPTIVGNEYPFEVGVAMPPQANPDEPKVISQGPSVCIFKKENSQEVLASWLFAKFVTTNIAFQGQYSSVSGYVPVIKSVENDETYKNTFLDFADGNLFLPATCVKVSNDMARLNAYYVSPAFNGSSMARDEVGQLMQYCFANTLGMDDNGIASYIADEFDYRLGRLTRKYGN